MKSADWPHWQIGLALVVTAIAMGITHPGTSIGSGPAVDHGTVVEIKPVPLPDPKIPGYHFPEDEATIIGWTKKNDQKAINLHGLGLLTAFTQPTAEQDLRA